MNVQEFLAILQDIAPLEGAAQWDNSGVQIAGLTEELHKIALTLDPVPDTIDAALEWGADFILTHHPLSIEPRFLNKLDAHHRIVSSILRHQAWLYAAHTSLDVQPDGPAGWLPRVLGLQDLQVLEPTHSRPYCGVRFQTGDAAGSLIEEFGDHPRVLHLEEALPGELLLVCHSDVWPMLRQEVSKKLDFPPAFGLLDLALPPKQWGFGLVGDLPETMPLNDFLDTLATHIDRSFYQISGELPETVSCVACCPGSGGSMIARAAQAGADIFITGDVKYHQALEHDLCVIDAGHFALEEEMMRRFTLELIENPALENIELFFFPGQEPVDLLLVESKEEETT
jgi:dinuclear metal center YbgI/SA1388 family protein